MSNRWKGPLFAVESTTTTTTVAGCEINRICGYGRYTTKVKWTLSIHSPCISTMPRLSNSIWSWSIILLIRMCLHPHDITSPSISCLNLWVYCTYFLHSEWHTMLKCQKKSVHGFFPKRASIRQASQIPNLSASLVWPSFGSFVCQ